jgi:ABC-type glutathione transport system ATPase component
MAESLIYLDGVTKVFVTDDVETHALAGIHLDIKKGEYLSIAGPSGCGKSTLLAILGLLDSPSDGTYVLNGKPRARSAGARRDVAPREALSVATLRRSAAARRSRSRTGWRSVDPTRGRAYRKPGFGERRSGDGSVA